MPVLHDERMDTVIRQHTRHYRNNVPVDTFSCISVRKGERATSITQMYSVSKFDSTEGKDWVSSSYLPKIYGWLP